MFGSSAFGGGGFGSGAVAPKNPNTNNSHEVAQSPGDTVSELAWSPAANILAAASWDKQVRIWEVTTQASTSAFGGSSGSNSIQATPKLAYGHEAPVMSCCFTKDGANVISAGCDNKVKMYNLQAQRDQQIGQHDAPVKKVVWVEEMKMCISGSWDKSLRFWSPGQPNPVATLQLPERLYAMDCNFPLLVCATADRHVIVYNLQTLTQNPNPYKSIQSALKMQTRCVACFPEKSGYAIASIEGRCSIAYVEENMKDKSFTFKCHRTNDEIYPVNAVDFHPTFSTFVTAGGDGTFMVWDKEQKQRLKAFQNCHYPITAAKFSTQGDMLAYAVGNDWSKGYEFAKNYPVTKILIHKVHEAEVKPKHTLGRRR